MLVSWTEGLQLSRPSRSYRVMGMLTCVHLAGLYVVPNMMRTKAQSAGSRACTVNDCGVRELGSYEWMMKMMKMTRLDPDFSVSSFE